MARTHPNEDEAIGVGAVLNRRTFLTLIAGLPVAGLGARTASAGPISVAAYHDATAADHQNQFDANDGLLKKGYRIRSLSVYRQGSKILYAAVWTTESGPAWQAFHNLTAASYQSYFDEWHGKGYRPIIVTATGGGIVGGNQKNESVFAGVFIKDSTPFTAHHDIDFSTFKETCTWAKAHQRVLRWAAIYGGTQRQYAGIWEQVTPNVTWDYQESIAIDGPEQGAPLTMPGHPSLRLAFVTRSAFAEYLGVYRSDQAGSWVERHGMTSAQYQKEHDMLKAKGYFPWYVQAGGDPRVNDVPRFVALFKKI